MEHVEIIKDSAYSLLTVIDDILDFSKIEAGKIDLEEEPVVLAYLVDSTCSAMQPIATRKNVRLRFYRDPNLPLAIMSDAVRLRQIIINLVGNAIKFSGSDQKQGRVDVRFEAITSGSICIRVIDNGIGMSQSAMQAVFEPFSQADTSTTRRFGGTGLGLPITKRIIDLMRGKMKLDSEPGVGTTFEIVIPVKAADYSSELQFRTRLDNYRCYLLCKDMSLFTDWANLLRNAGATVKQIASMDTLDFAQMTSNVNSDSPNVLVTIDEDARIDDYQAAIENAPEKALRRLILVRPLEHQTISVENEEFTIVGTRPNLNTSFEYVVSAVLGDVAHLLDDEEESSESARVVSREEAELTGRMILVAEDNDINRKVIKSQLDLLGYACDIAGNGEEALELWGKNHYSLLLTDLHMPVLDGYELTAAIRKQEKNGDKRLPILAFTANATKSERKACIDAGMNDYLPKPVPLENLQQKLSRWTNQPGAENDPSGVSAANNATSTQVQSVLDVSVLEKLVGADQSVIKSFLHDYKESSQRSASAIESAYKEGEWEKVGKIAHALKSSSQSVGALALGEICAELENAGKLQDEKQIHLLMKNFQQSLHAVVEWFGKRDI